ncbi:uncharacterized protein CTRU02_205836 [Colletotrichum truncatum]|uniref:Uncharacterized protein n=1 Tax=Colletotrichum truncatum TaxID=5467 RepID=A0ACC3Z555_COLTU|nr:uncharacterized protein CTRU02_04664 [Colletotrichum truncatum]KAF6795101.1 hypothetical protein CTRU02_04664 [Colletotrichum truncatum]
MVSAKSVLCALSIQVIAVTAAPLASANPETALIAQASVHMCEHIRWTGACRNQLVPLDSCRNVPAAWNDRISSIRNDSRLDYKCTWYIHSNCRGASYSNQNDANLRDGNGRFNDSISSFSCKRR